jgi:hypothetical protein
MNKFLSATGTNMQTPKRTNNLTVLGYRRYASLTNLMFPPLSRFTSSKFKIELAPIFFVALSLVHTATVDCGGTGIFQIIITFSHHPIPWLITRTAVYAHNDYCCSVKCSAGTCLPDLCEINLGKSLSYYIIFL